MFFEAVQRPELDTLIAMLGVVLAAVVLPSVSAVPVLTFLVGLLLGVLFSKGDGDHEGKPPGPGDGDPSQG